MAIEQRNVTIILAVIVVIASAAVLVYTNWDSSPSKSVGTLTVDPTAANEFTDVMHFYIAGSDGSGKVCIDTDGDYSIPSDPVFIIEIADSAFTAGTFGKDFMIYTSAFTDGVDDYQIVLQPFGATVGTPSVSGNTVTYSMSVGSDGKVQIDDPVSYAVESITCYCPYNDGADYEIKYCTTHVLANPTFDNMPSGKTIDYWTYYTDGSGTKIHEGDTLPYPVGIYAVLKDA